MSGSRVGRGANTVDLRARVDAGLVRSWIETAATSMSKHRDRLTQLDAAIGDADHGVNMHRGFSRALVEIEPKDETGPSPLLEVVGRTLVYTVGGAAGPLYGSAFRAAAASLGRGQSLDAEALLAALRASLEAIQGLGAAEPGDKTIVDAWEPALSAFERELRSGGSLASAAERAAAAAEGGAKDTIPLQARKGRASYLGARSVGHQDPGATSTALLFEALAEAARSAGA